MRIYLTARFPVFNLILWSLEMVELLNHVQDTKACADDRYELYESVVFFANSVEKRLSESRSLEESFNLSERLLEATIKGIIPHQNKMAMVVAVLSRHWTRAKDLELWYEARCLEYTQGETQQEFVGSAVED